MIDMMLILIILITIFVSSFIVAKILTVKIYENKPERPSSLPNGKKEVRSVFIEYNEDKWYYNEYIKYFKIRDIFATMCVISLMSIMIWIVVFTVIDLLK